MEYRRNVLLVVAIAAGGFVSRCPGEGFDRRFDLSQLRSVQSVDQSSDELPSLRLSTANGEDFAFNVHIYGRPSKAPSDVPMSYAKLMIANGTPAYAFVFMGGTMPAAAHFGSDFLVLSRSGKWHRVTDNRWGLFVDSDHFDGGFSDVGLMPEGVDHWIVFDLESCLHGLLQSSTGTVEWSMPTQTVVITTPSVRTLLRQRSPNDRIYLGTPLSLLSAEFVNATIRVASFRCGEGDPLAESVKTESELAELVSSTKVEKPPRLITRFRDKKAAQRAAMAMWRAVMEKPLIGNDRHLVQTLRTRALQYGTAANQRAFEAVMQKGFLGTYVKVFVEQLAELDRIAREDADGQILLIDDPAIRWGQVLRRISPAEMRLASDSVLPQLLRSPQMSLEQKILVVDAVGDLGDPLLPYFDKIFKDVDPEEWLLFDALFKARWQRPWTEEHVERCSAALAEIEGGSDAELVLVETLIRMDETAQIPINRMHRWFEDCIVEASAFERSESLRILTLVPSGRHYLLAHLQSDAFSIPEDVRKQCLEALRRRCSATRHFGQYEFLSEQECHRIEKYLAEQDAL